MLSERLLEILRCPNCNPNDGGLLTYHQGSWLICNDCGRKYPVVGDLPVMLLEEGGKYIDTPIENLPIPPKYP
ncbi:MAG: Trm112 family protein [Anaerolineae bacterium]|nr:Trm112 family protein [Anaerolineae bacterium]